MVFKKKYELVFLFLLIFPILLLRVTIESTNYCTPDSVYYLEVSKNILSGLGCVGPKTFDYNSDKSKLIPLYDKTPFGQPNLYEKEYFAVWPLGYPLCIVAVSYVTTLPPLWASKLLNILLLGLDFYLLFLLFSGSSYLPLYYFCSFTMLEICSYTWSENLFIPFFLMLILSIKKIHTSTTILVKYILLLALALFGMCMARYASIIFYVSTFVVLLHYLRRQAFEKAKMIFFGLVISTISLSLYLFNNYIQSGYVTGMPRTNTQDYTSIELTGKFFMGIFHQLHLIKQFRISGTADLIFYLFSTTLQLSLMAYLFYILINNSIEKNFSEKSKLMLSLGFIYLIFLIYMTYTSVIDPFDYRTLLPFSFPVSIALLAELEARLTINNRNRAILVVKAFFVFSLVVNLPKKYLLGLLF